METIQWSGSNIQAIKIFVGSNHVAANRLNELTVVTKTDILCIKVLDCLVKNSEGVISPKKTLS